MRIPWQPFSASLLMSSALLSYTAHAMDCDIHFDSNKWNLQALGGVRVFQTFEDQGDVTLNTTWVMNICNILHRAATRGGHKCGTSKNSTYYSSFILFIVLIPFSVNLDRGNI